MMKKTISTKTFFTSFVADKLLRNIYDSEHYDLSKQLSVLQRFSSIFLIFGLCGGVS